jgi:biotin synthase-related radical SAM superfamily protein
MKMAETDEGMLSPTKKKAALILGGPVKVPPGMKLPFRLSCSTAGPGAGSCSIVLAFEGVRVKKAVNNRDGEFELVPRGDRYALHRKGKAFIEDVEIQPVLFHAPEQAFFNLDNRCIYGCAFCASPFLDGEFEKGRTPGSVIQDILEAHRKEDFDSVAITSAVPDSPGETVDRIIQVIRSVREAFPGLTIGVEPYISEPEQIDALKAAGANEIKINIETYDRAIFEKVCPNKDYDQIMSSIEHAVEVFGRGKVTSNIIIGLGESDRTVLKGIEHLAKIGCVATLRALRTNGINRTNLSTVIGDVRPVDEDRLIRLAKAQKEILEAHGLTTVNFRTMCHQCGCCDIVPFKDIV